MTAAIYGIPSAAFSLDVGSDADEAQWRSAADIAGQILPALPGIESGVVLNVNIPNAPADRIRGIRQGRLATAGAVQLSIGQAASGYLQLTMAEPEEEPTEGTDSALLAAGYAAVTALRPVCGVTSAGLPWPPG